MLKNFPTLILHKADMKNIPYSLYYVPATAAGTALYKMATSIDADTLYSIPVTVFLSVE